MSATTATAAPVTTTNALNVKTEPPEKSEDPVAATSKDDNGGKNKPTDIVVVSSEATGAVSNSQTMDTKPFAPAIKRVKKEI